MGQVAKGESAQGREMAAYLLCKLRSAAEEQPKPVPGLEARVGGAESNHAAPAAHRDRCTAVDLRTARLMPCRRVRPTTTPRTMGQSPGAKQSPMALGESERR